VLNPVILFDLSQSLRRHRKLAGMSPDCLVNKTLTFATGTSCGTPMNGPERLHAVSADLCQSGLCSQQPPSISHAIENVVIGVARYLHLLNTADKCPINPHSVVPGWLGS